MPEYVPTPGKGAAVKEREKVETPRRFKVILLNDHYTTMEFVVDLLQEVYRKPHDEAMRIMLNVHEHGRGIAGVYVKSIAESKIAATHQRARDAGYPLRCTLEAE